MHHGIDLVATSPFDPVEIPPVAAPQSAAGREKKIEKDKEKQIARGPELGPQSSRTVKELRARKRAILAKSPPLADPVAAPASAPPEKEKNFERDKKRG